MFETKVLILLPSLPHKIHEVSAQSNYNKSHDDFHLQTYDEDQLELGKQEIKLKELDRAPPPPQ